MPIGRQDSILIAVSKPAMHSGAAHFLEVMMSRLRPRQRGLRYQVIGNQFAAV
jgi:hypothetical protein